MCGNGAGIFTIHIPPLAAFVAALGTTIPLPPLLPTEQAMVTQTGGSSASDSVWPAVRGTRKRSLKAKESVGQELINILVLQSIKRLYTNNLR